MSTDNEIVLESRLEQALRRENDHRNCANCVQYRKKPCMLIDPRRVCSKHEWDKIERMERSYD